MSEPDERSTSIPGLVHGQLCYLQLPAADINVSAEFYERIFGWRVDPPESGFEAPSLIGQWITDRPPSPDGGPVGWILVEDIRRTLREAHQAGATLRDGPSPDGPRWLASFSDPAGNLLGVVQHRGAPTGEEVQDSAPPTGGEAPRIGVENRTMPPAAVMPVLVYDDVPAAIDWLCAAFGFSERWRAGDHRAVLEFGGGAVMLGDTSGRPRPADGPPGPGDDHGVMVRVSDADAHRDHAQRHGAQVTDGPRSFPYGERQYNAIDIGGHEWTFSQSIADVAPEDWGGTSAPPALRLR
ncbi:MAG: VOC family protein [Solirubrobacteraceae bacterium]